MTERPKTDSDQVKDAVEGYLCAVMRGESREKVEKFVQVSMRGFSPLSRLPHFQEYEIERVLPSGGKSNVQRGVVVKLRFQVGGGEGLRWVRYRLGAVKENEEGNCDPDGEWGVTPSVVVPMENAE